MPDPETIRVYDARATEYAEINAKDSAAATNLSAFIDACPAKGRILDLGCGPGASAAAMARAGLLVDASDASAEMVALASRHPGVTAFQAEFKDISGVNIYDGIWASFSLLHAPRADFPGHLSALRNALKPGGLFYLAMKLGSGESRDSIGRHYSYYSTEELDTFLMDTGFTDLSHDFGASRGMDGKMADYVTITAHG